MTKVENQIQIAEERLRCAMLTSNSEILDELISPELLFTNHMGQVLTKQDDLALHQSGILKFHALDPSESQMKISEKMAIVSVCMKMSGVYNGNPFRGNLRYTRVWHLSQNNAWQVVAGHSCTIQDKFQLSKVIEALAAREPIFHRPEFGTSRADFEAMVTPGFWEIGASGTRYTKAHILHTLENRHSRPVTETYEMTDFACQELSQSLYLVTYQLNQAGRLSQRSTIWCHNDSGVWQIVFHQGTLVSP